MRGKEPDIAYQPWALEKAMSEYPATGPDGRYELTTDAWINYLNRRLCGDPDFATLIWPTLRFSFGPPWKTKTA
jgi:hypothetical protein